MTACQRQIETRAAEQLREMRFCTEGNWLCRKSIQ